MKQEFENYSLVRDSNKVALNYKRSNKDWMDIIVKSIVVLLVGFFVWFLINAFANSDIKWYHYIMMLVVFVGYLFILIELGVYLFSPTGKIICIDKKNDEVSIKRLFGKVEKIKLTDVRVIEYTLHEDFVRYSTGVNGKIRCRMEVQIISNEHTKVDALTINTNQIIDPGHHEVKEMLIKRSRKMINMLAKEMGVMSQWNGIVKEE